VGAAITVGILASYGVGLLNAEVFPTAIRRKGSSLGVFTHWGLDFVVSLTVLTLVGLVAETGLFWIYGAFGVAGLVYLIRYLPETKGRTLEQVEDELRRR
jgi:Sugar (and other) transporter